jgi:thiamine-phosphate pyrophosphorylase
LHHADKGKGGRTPDLGALPSLLFVTDPARTPDPEAIAARLPPGSGVIFRHFGAADAEAQGLRLAALAEARGLILLVGADPALAARIGADGVHLPERQAHLAAGLLRRHPDWIVTAAAHSARAILRARRAGADAVLLSPVFLSRSPSAGRPLGLMRFAALARNAGVPVYALGGASIKNAPRLFSAGAAGIAGVDGLRT